MTEDRLDFSYDLGDADRVAIIAEAASALDTDGRLVSFESAGADSEAQALRDLGSDRLDLATYPDFYKITDRDFLDHGRPAPVRLAHLTRDFDFYWIRFPIDLIAAPSWRFDRLEVEVLLSAEGEAHLQPRTYQILPNRSFQDLVKAETNLEVSIDENFELRARAAASLGSAGAGAGVDVKAATSAHVVAGPFHYRIRKANIDHSATGLDRIFWRIDGDAFLEEGAPDLVAIVQIPKRAGHPVKAQITAQATRFFSYARADLKDAILGLPARILAFFKGGAPIRAHRAYDLTPRL